ncbi:MAG: cytochrome c3 family protein [Syntrophorhabdaceae bacterium]|nr:cytochrome c family protein [Syntrophorhabdaceae bacterium]MDD4195052.1 cytochrome c3 family protein [Syntrophorhabdaceae bacterium]
MNKKFKIFVGTAMIIFFVAILFQLVYAQKKAPEPLMLKLEGVKFPPVTFSHSVHTDKAKVDCVACHHKDKNPKEPGGCMPCHDRNEVKNGAPPIKDAYHKNCIDCHKESVVKNVSAPTKCNDCHKKQ